MIALDDEGEDSHDEDENVSGDAADASPHLDEGSGSDGDDDEGSGGGLDDLENDLEALKEQDPDFYEYMKQNNPDMLGTADEDEDEDGDDAGDEDGEEGGSDNGREDRPGRTGPRVLDAAIFRQLRKAIETEVSPGAVKNLVQIFRACTLFGAEAEGIKYKAKWVIDSESVFEMVLTFCVPNMGRIFDSLFKYKRTAGQPVAGGAGRGIKLPNRKSQLWEQHKPLVKSYLVALLELMKDIGEPRMAAFVSRHTVATMCPYMALIPGSAARLLRCLIMYWTDPNDVGPAHVFLAIRSLALNMPFPFIHAVLRSTYLAFARSCKNYNAVNADRVTFMSNCLVELFGLDFKASYEVAFVYVRQLAIHLRAALQAKTKDSYSSVYNWQFINCARVWTEVVARYPESPEFKDLLYPLAQVLIGTIQIVPTARFFPLRFQVVAALHAMAKSTGVYVPTASILLDTLESAGLSGKPKGSKDSKPIDLTFMLRAPVGSVGTGPFLDAVVDEALFLLAESLSFASGSAAFPEVSVPTIHSLKNLLKPVNGSSAPASAASEEDPKGGKKDNPGKGKQGKNDKKPRNDTRYVVMRFGKAIKVIIDKIEQNSKEVLRRRARADFAPKDISRLDAFDDQSRLADPAPGSLRAYVELQRRVREAKRGRISAETIKDARKSKEAERRKAEENERENGRGNADDGEEDEDLGSADGSSAEESELRELEAEERRAGIKQGRVPDEAARGKAAAKRDRRAAKKAEKSKVALWDLNNLPTDDQFLQNPDTVTDLDLSDEDDADDHVHDKKHPGGDNDDDDDGNDDDDDDDPESNHWSKRHQKDEKKRKFDGKPSKPNKQKKRK